MDESERTPVTRVELKRVGLWEWVHSEDRLRASGFLRCIGEDARPELFEGVATRRFGPRSHVFDVGDSGTSLFFLLRGEVRQVIRAESGPVDVAMVHPGEVFGEDVILAPGASRSCAALAAGEVDVAEFTGAQIQRAVSRWPQLRSELERVHVARLAARDEMLAFVGRW